MAYYKEFRYGPPPYSFYRKDWKLPPQKPIEVIVSDRSHSRKGHETKINPHNLIQLFPYKPASRHVPWYNSVHLNSDNIEKAQIAFPKPPAPIMPWESKNPQPEEPLLSEIEQEFYNKIFEWIPYPGEYIQLPEIDNPTIS